MNSLLLIFVAVNSVKLAFTLIWKREFRSDLWASLGFTDPKIPQRKPGAIRIWIHAVSLGETKAIEPFIEMVKRELPDIEIVKSSITGTGHAESLKRKDLFDHSFYLPIDFSWRSRRLAKKIDPDLFILVENDYWPNLLTAIKARGTKIALINGRISLDSYQRYRLWPSFAKKIFSSFDLLCVQAEEFKERFKELGVAPEKIYVTGNVKLDAKPTPSKITLSLPEGKKIITIASTHEGEEEMILEAIKELDDRVCILLAPRHPQRFAKVEELLKAKQIPFRKINEPPTHQEKVILVDMIGVLDDCFKASNVAVLGGSFVTHVGGHNIFEPTRLGIPVIYGPHMHNQEKLVRLFKKHNVGKQVELSSLKNTLEEYLNNPIKTENIESLIDEVAGATERSWDLIKKL